jgi:(heptosyl)LPS beta-1,4-glucosyltransferase
VTTSISVVINTLNEESNIRYALRSVRTWVDEIVVVDMHSDDRTREIAEEYGARVYLHDRVGYADPAREFALAKATGDWILILDADELIPPCLARRLSDIAAAGQADVVSIPRLNYMLGRPFVGTGWGPTQDHHERYFKKGCVEARSDIHAFLRVRPEARIVRLPPEEGLAMVHFNYLDTSHFLEKLNRYTSIEAQEALERGERSTIPRAVRRGAREWWQRYVAGRGYRDGWRGFYLSAFMVLYRIAIQVKLKELADLGGRATIEAGYHREAERILAEYGGPPDRDEDSTARDGDPPSQA